MSKYLTFEERIEIQQGLKNHLSFGKIAIIIGKDRTTVVKEIKKYAFEQKNGYSSYLDFNAVRLAFIFLQITSMVISIIGFGQGFLEMIRDSVGTRTFVDTGDGQKNGSRL